MYIGDKRGTHLYQKLTQVEDCDRLSIKRQLVAMMETTQSACLWTPEGGFKSWLKCPYCATGISFTHQNILGWSKLIACLTFSLRWLAHMTPKLLFDFMAIEANNTEVVSTEEMEKIQTCPVISCRLLSLFVSFIFFCLCMFVIFGIRDLKGNKPSEAHLP